MQQVNSGQVMPQGSDTLTEFFRDVYQPWVEKNRATTTAEGYRKTWNKYLEPHIGKIALANLQTQQVTALLTHFSEWGRRARTLSHAKWLLSGIFEYAIATGVVTANPVPSAKWLTRPKETTRAIRRSIHSAKRRRQAARPRFAKYARHCSRTGKGGHCMGWLLRWTARLLVADD